MKTEKHENLSELVADLRNKIVPIVSYYSLMDEMDKLNKLDNSDMQKIMLEDYINKTYNYSKDYIDDIINLLYQFENFDLK